MPLAGGIMQHGYQCGMIWGVSLGAGAQAYWADPWGGPRAGPGWGGGPWSEPDWGGGPWTEPGRGGPWSESDYPYRGYGPVLDRTHQRQSQMRDHRAAMQSVARMLSGRRTFDRAEAIGLAREIEASAGENLARLFQPGDRRRSPLSRARIGEEMETFQAHAEALKVAAGELADALENRPSAEDIRAGRAWSPDWRRGGPYRSRWRHEGGALNMQVFDAYSKLRATCNGCHASFRSAWR